MRHLHVLGLALFLSACGGGSADPKSSSDAKKKNDDVGSIGDLAAAQGGIAALGGAGNREEATGVESAMTAQLRAEEVDAKKPVRVDGVLKEWHGRVPAKEAISGKTDGVELGVAVQYDETKLYVAAEVSDPKPKRGAAHGDGDDRVTFTLAFPGGRGALKAYEIGLWPGKPGESVGAVKWLSGAERGSPVAGAKIVEADVKGGFTIEAAIPWSSFPEAKTMRVGLRAAFRYHDAGGGVVGTGAGSVDKPGDLPPLPTASEQAVVEGLLTQKHVESDKPKIDVYVDLVGDERKERVSVFGKFFTICGPGYRGGHQFFWRESTADIVSVEPREITGRGKEDLVVRKRQQFGNALHEIVEVWSNDHGDEPDTIFAHQVGIAAAGGKQRITNSVRISAKEIEVTTEPAVNWKPEGFKEMVASDIEGILLPWGTVKSRTYKLEGHKFVRGEEVAQKPGAAPAPPSTATASTQTTPTPAIKTQIVDAYLKEANLAAGTKPKFDLEVNVDGDTRVEHVLLVGRDLVVVRAEPKGGFTYGKISLGQFADDKDVQEITARDLTGDGGAEIIVRGERHVRSPQGDQVDIGGLFIYRSKEGNLVRVFAIETGRELGGKRVQGQVQFVPAKNGKGMDIDVKPGAAKGWDAKSYPWPEEKPGGAIEPLLLPWGTQKSLRYTWTGDKFALP